MSATEFLPGDLVFLGPEKPLDRAVIWTVLDTYTGADGLEYAILQSGMTERRTIALRDRLTPFRPRLREPAAP